jgi:hypothetical protein
MIRLDSPEASAEPRELTVQAQVGGASETVRFQDVVVGEVWLMSGQSNMQMPLRGYSSQPVLRSNDAVARANDRNLRLFSVLSRTRLPTSRPTTSSVAGKRPLPPTRSTSALSGMRSSRI